MTLHGLLFDFDGTLAPNLDLPDMRRQVIELTKHTGVPESVFADRYIVEIIDAATAWLGDQGARYAREAHQLIIDIEMGAAANTQLIPGTENVLHELRRQGLKLGVVTRNCRAALLTVCPHLETLVDAIHARDDVEHLKPDTRHLQTSLDTLGVPAVHAAMVGDGALDMHAGRALDLYCIGVLGGSSDRARLSSAGADAILDGVHGLLQHLTSKRLLHRPS